MGGALYISLPVSDSTGFGSIRISTRRNARACPSRGAPPEATDPWHSHQHQYRVIKYSLNLRVSHAYPPRPPTSRRRHRLLAPEEATYARGVLQGTLRTASLACFEESLMAAFFPALLSLRCRRRQGGKRRRGPVGHDIFTCVLKDWVSAEFLADNLEQPCCKRLENSRGSVGGGADGEKGGR